MWCFPLRFDLVDGSWSYSSMKDENPLVSSQMYTERFWCCPLRNFQPAIFAHKQQKSGIQTKCIKTNRMRVKQICMSCRYCLWWVEDSSVLTSEMSDHSESATLIARIIDQVYPWGTGSLSPHTRLPREPVPLFTLKPSLLPNLRWAAVISNRKIFTAPIPRFPFTHKFALFFSSTHHL